jgi:hypothetical protein
MIAAEFTRLTDIFTHQYPLAHFYIEVDGQRYEIDNVIFSDNIADNTTTADDATETPTMIFSSGVNSGDFISRAEFNAAIQDLQDQLGNLQNSNSYIDTH